MARYVKKWARVEFRGRFGKLDDSSNRIAIVQRDCNLDSGSIVVRFVGARNTISLCATDFIIKHEDIGIVSRETNEFCFA